MDGCMDGVRIREKDGLGCGSRCLRFVLLTVVAGVLGFFHSIASFAIPGSFVLTYVCVCLLCSLPIEKHLFSVGMCAIHAIGGAMFFASLSLSVLLCVGVFFFISSCNAVPRFCVMERGKLRKVVLSHA